jgi:AmmeMemoRadiSam system protein B
VVVTGEHKGQDHPQDHPKVRPLDAFPLQVEGRQVIGIKDPAGIASDIVCVPPETFFLISLMDGTNSLLDLQAAYMRKYGTLLFSDKIEGLIEELNSHYLLETRRFEDYLRQLRDDFKNLPTREAAFAGKGYEGDPMQLKAQLRGYFQGKDGPRLPAQGGEKGLKGIVAPHIDFQRGGTCYAHAYKALGEAAEADLYIILGTCHTPMQNPFAFTLKPFATPLGMAEVTKDAVAAIAADLPFDPLLDEFSHRNEHTIEFQVVFLQHLLGNKPVQIFPILCCSFHEMIQKGISPMEDPVYKAAITTLAQRCREIGRTCLIASADLAHVGPQFGQNKAITPGVLSEVRSKDLEMLHYGEELNGEGLFQYILREGDRRNICGLPPLYALLHLIDAEHGQLLNYQQWSDPAGQGAVTFASMAFA